MIKRNIQAWYKFAFKLFVNEQWDVIAERVENGDQTWRRCVKEQNMEGLRVVEREAWEKHLSGTIFNLKLQLESLHHSIITDEEYINVRHFLTIPRGMVIASDTIAILIVTECLPSNYGYWRELYCTMTTLPGLVAGCVRHLTS